ALDEKDPFLLVEPGHSLVKRVVRPMAVGSSPRRMVFMGRPPEPHPALVERRPEGDLAHPPFEMRDVRNGSDARGDFQEDFLLCLLGILPMAQDLEADVEYPILIRFEQRRQRARSGAAF